ncbi:MAG: hypothetical protein DSO07_01475 [Thermoproteota archaeon]|uniref:DUF116 domain-containing protein n=1 Tax=Candidatus Methanodesulfokora washburnensis TaxID=2478471 RepID=A0A429GND8_9CREN|nr:DUF116 domain-containing protein [Candidatus Methanodesulfokores washburnensis]TDA42049.1 MAG: hypothetical protein DSO07_01475 [Candidatus Korarchaeota archaeon]
MKVKSFKKKLNRKQVPYRFNFDLSAVPRQFFEEILRASYERGIHKRMANKAMYLVRMFKLDELTGLDLQNAITVVEDMLEICIMSEMGRRKFGNAKRKALFLPHCSRKYMDSRCKAIFDESIPSYLCQKCSSDCLIRRAIEIAEERGYDVYVVPGGSCIPKILERGGYDAVVGVACGMELKLASKFLSNIPAQGIPLVKNGCSLTRFDLDSLKRALI